MKRAVILLFLLIASLACADQPSSEEWAEVVDRAHELRAAIEWLDDDVNQRTAGLAIKASHGRCQLPYIRARSAASAWDRLEENHIATLETIILIAFAGETREHLAGAVSLLDGAEELLRNNEERWKEVMSSVSRDDENCLRRCRDAWEEPDCR